MPHLHDCGSSLGYQDIFMELPRAREQIVPTLRIQKVSGYIGERAVNIKLQDTLQGIHVDHNRPNIIQRVVAVKCYITTTGLIHIVI